MDILVRDIGVLLLDPSLITNIQKLWNLEYCASHGERLDRAICERPEYVVELLRRIQAWLIQYQRLANQKRLPLGADYTALLMGVAQDFVDLGAALERLTHGALTSPFKGRIYGLLEDLLGCSLRAGSLILRLFQNIGQSSVVEYLRGICQRLIADQQVIAELPKVPSGFGVKSCERCDAGIRARATTYLPDLRDLKTWTTTALDSRIATIRGDIQVCEDCLADCRRGGPACANPVYRTNSSIYDQLLVNARRGLEQLQKERARR